MAFKQDIPQYKNYSEEKFYMHSVPDDVWSELQGLIVRYANNDCNMLKKYLNQFSTIIPYEPTQNWGWSFLISDIPYFVSEIRNKVKKGHFDILMDCIAVLIDGNDDRANEMNDYLEEHNIGYACELDLFSKQVVWFVKDESNADVREKLTLTKLDVKSVSKQAFEEIDRALKIVESDYEHERSRKDAVRNCVSAMEAVVKAYGNNNEIKNASKTLRDAKIWGADWIVKEGDAIFNIIHRYYPDLRHGSTSSSTISKEEASYLIERITIYINYMQKMAKKLGRE